ncbi:MAG: hypothetical protein ACK6AD_09995 [Cyanobacteriota bacterium]|jgi:hypothetical protein
MFDFGDELHSEYGFHRHGWSWVVSKLAEKLHSPNAAIRILSFAEQSLLFQGHNSHFYSPYTPTKPWIGIFHLPPRVPFVYSRSHQLSRLRDEPRLAKIMQSCLASISLSSYLENYISTSIHPARPAYTVLHPAPYNVDCFNLELVLAHLRTTGHVRLIQLGFWLRKHHLIHSLKHSIPHRIEAFHVGINNDSQMRIVSLDLSLHNVSAHDNVYMTYRLNARDYDHLLTNALVLLPLYDTSANNSLIECITRCTPVIIERHPAVVQYLGADYPFYYQDFDQLLCLLESPLLAEKIAQAHDYLYHLRESRHLSIDTCIDSLMDFASTL